MNDSVRILRSIIDNVENVIVGKRSAVELAVISLICNGHVLIEDVPGVGKTSLVSAIAKSINASFRRIQFTPDILPSDITGFSIYNQKTGDFEYRPGAIMSQIILADEINRTSPKTQASLLEVMEERQVTVTALPTRYHSRSWFSPHRIPWSTSALIRCRRQIDRFFMKISIGYPTNAEESYILARFQHSNPLEKLMPVAESGDITALQEEIKNVHLDKSLSNYIVEIVSQTRKHPDVTLGSSPRGSLALFRASQAWAFYNGRDYVIPDDIRKMVEPVLSHRLMLKQEAKLKKVNPVEILNYIVS